MASELELSEAEETIERLQAQVTELADASKKLLAHIADVLDDDCFDTIDTALWNALGSAIAKVSA